MAKWIFPSETEYYTLNGTSWNVTIIEGYDDYDTVDHLIFHLHGKNIEPVPSNCRFIVYNNAFVEAPSIEFIVNDDGTGIGMCDEYCYIPLGSLSSEATQEFYFYIEMYDNTYSMSTDPISITLTQYTITFDANGGTGELPDNIVGNFYKTGVQLSSGNLIRTGYKFVGWSESSEESVNNLYTTDGLEYSFYGDIILYAVWKPNTYTITLNPTIGTLSYGNSFNVTYNSSDNNDLIVLDFRPVHDRYAFLGYYTLSYGGIQVYDENGHCVNETGYWTDDKWIYDGDVTLYAQWDIDSYAYYKLNGEWVLCQRYVKTENGWKPTVIKIKENGVFV